MKSLKKNCLVCNNLKQNSILTVPEYASLDNQVYEYMKCGNCGGLQLIWSKDSFSQLYDSSYGSFITNKQSFLKRLLRKFRNRWAFMRRGGFLGWALCRFKPLPVDFTIVSQYADECSSILDVGCGMGSYLNELHDAGFKNLQGIDPFLKNDLLNSSGIPLFKSDIENFSGSFDVIVSHHSFEHVKNPNQFLISASRLIRTNGVIIITVPIIDFVYKQFQAHTSIIMPPQHTFMYTIDGMKHLLINNKFEILEIKREADSNLEWLINSYKIERKGAGENKVKIPRRVLLKFKKMVEELKEQDLGDNVVFVVKPSL